MRSMSRLVKTRLRRKKCCSEHRPLVLQSFLLHTLSSHPSTLPQRAQTRQQLQNLLPEVAHGKGLELNLLAGEALQTRRLGGTFSLRRAAMDSLLLQHCLMHR